MKHSPKLFYAAIGLVMVGAAYVPKSYTVSHTESEWGQHVQGLERVKDVIHKSDLPANVAFWCDSALTSQQNDIYSQVLPQIKADTLKTKKP